MAKGDWLPGALLGIAVKKFMGGAQQLSSCMQHLDVNDVGAGGAWGRCYSCRTPDPCRQAGFWRGCAS